MTETRPSKLLEIALLASLVCALLTLASSEPSPESPYKRDYFYVGGRYVADDTGQHTFREQMYVEHLVPIYAASHKYPLVFIHGQAQTGTNWLNTPDGRKGWASWLIDKGYEVYLIDQTKQGRSPWFPGDGTQITYSAELVQQRFTAPELFHLWPQAHLHTQWPGAGLMGDPTFDAFYASNVQVLSNGTEQQQTMQKAGAALLDRIGPVILIAHSQGGSMPWLIADARPELVKGIFSIEPSGPPFRGAVISNTSARPYGLTDIPLTYDPPVTDPMKPLASQEQPSASANLTSCVLQAEPARKLIQLQHIPVLLVTSEASYHAPYDHCNVEFLIQAGVQTEHLKLADLGIHGNGHMLFMEKNNLEIIEALEPWLAAIP